MGGADSVKVVAIPHVSGRDVFCNHYMRSGALTPSKPSPFAIT